MSGAINDQALRWPLLLPLSLVGGAALYMTAPFEPSWELLLGASQPVAIAPAAAAIALWLTAPQAVGYVANDGSVFLKAERGWIELTDWRGENGRNPLIIGDEITKAPCPGKGMACWLDTPAGQYAVLPTMDSPSPGCPTASILTLSPATGAPLTIRPCEASLGGAAIEMAGDKPQLSISTPQSGRPWTQPLYARPPKAER